MTRHKRLQWGPRIILRGFVVVMGRPLGILHRHTIGPEREQNVYQSMQQRGSTLKMKTLRALM